MNAHEFTDAQVERSIQGAQKAAQQGQSVGDALQFSIAALRVIAEWAATESHDPWYLQANNRSIISKANAALYHLREAAAKVQEDIETHRGQP